VIIVDGSYNETSTIKLKRETDLEYNYGFGLAKDESSNTIYVADAKSGTVSLIDGIRDKLIDNINITSGEDPELRNATLDGPVYYLGSYTRKKNTTITEWTSK